MQFWANDGLRADGTPHPDLSREFEEVYKCELSGRHWEINSGVSLAALWTAACCRNKRVSKQHTKLALDAIGGTHDPQTGFYTPILVALDVETTILKSTEAISEEATLSMVKEMEGALRTADDNNLLLLKLRLYKTICHVCSTLASQYGPMKDLVSKSMVEKETLKSRILADVGVVGEEMLTEL